MSRDASLTAKRTQRLAALLLAFGAWGTLAPYAGPEVPVSASVEVVDHVIPGVIVLAVAAFAVQRRRFELIPAALALLAGLWMTVSHVPLLAMAARGETPWDGAVWMFAPSVSVLLLAGWTGAIAWVEDAKQGRSAPADG